MTDDPHVLRPDHLPTPFSADEIRVGCPPGRTVRSLVVQADRAPFVRVTRFVAGDAEGADYVTWTETPDGISLTEPERGRSTWLEFQGHASMPAATTTISDVTIEIPAGRFECLEYVRRNDDSISTFWFARSAPGMPLKVEERSSDGVLVFSSVAIENLAG
jgi:hypothetical protein